MKRGSAKEVRRTKRPARVPASECRHGDVGPLIVTYVLDETGSMQSVAGATVEGFNSYIDGIRRDARANVRITLLTFNTDTGTMRRFQNTPPCCVPNMRNASLYSCGHWHGHDHGYSCSEHRHSGSGIDFRPAGGTPLYDAIADGIVETEHALRQGNADVVFVIHTDGQENQSRRYTREDINEKITVRRNRGWTFLFLGADQEAWTHAGAIGISYGNTLSYDHTYRGTSGAYHTLKSATINYANASVADRATFTSNLMSWTATGGDASTPVDARTDKKRGGVVTNTTTGEKP